MDTIVDLFISNNFLAKILFYVGGQIQMKNTEL